MMNNSIDWTGLDYDFLRYIGVNASVQRQNQRFYLPFFKGCRRVADIGCGDGDFVELLRENGSDAFGVDSDPIAIQHLRERNIPVIETDVVSYLKAAEPESLDGVFTAHLIEHLPYQGVYELIHYAYRALKPGGTMVITTPNARALISHVEMFWQHFGHIAFYDPRLLCFFLHRVGFQNETWGENPAPAYPLSGGARMYESLTAVPDLPVDWEAAPPDPSLSGWRRAVRSRLARLLGLDDIVRQSNIQLRQLLTQSTQLIALMERLDRPFECYVTAVKP
jgi:SAM-dependent methyltransferase